ncbi:hypothetical protein GCM10009624_12340 [Gordonia sinesedis]
MPGSQNRRRASGRPFRRALIAVVLAIALIASMSAATAVVTGQRSGPTGCAEMTDAVGLYPGNDLTMRGVRIGSITDIAPQNGHVVVRFRLDDDIAFPADVSAVTTSDSIVTDRRLEIPSGRISGPAWDMRRCIPLSRTHTPRSVSEAYAAFDKLSREVTDAAASSPQQRQLVRDAMNSVNDSLRGTAGDFNDAIRGLAAALGDPALRDTQFRSLLTNVDALTGYFVERWPDLRLGLTKLGEFAETFDAWFSTLNPAIVETTALTPTLLRLIRTYSPLVFGILDALMPILDRIPVQTIVDILRKIPPISAGLQRIVSAGAAGSGIPVAPPRFRVTASDGVCAQVNAVLRGGCAPSGDAGRVDVDLLRLVLSSVGGR